MSIDALLEELGITLPEFGPPMGSYVHAVQGGNQLYLAGKGPFEARGKVGADVTVEEAYTHARETGLTLIAVMKQELGSLDRVARVVKVFGMVNAVPEFGEQPQVIDGCSESLRGSVRRSRTPRPLCGRDGLAPGRHHRRD